jgi:hypothetical protein
MMIFVYLALFGWVPAVFAMFALLPARTAAATAVIGAWLLLPHTFFPSWACPIFPIPRRQYSACCWAP